MWNSAGIAVAALVLPLIFVAANWSSPRRTAGLLGAGHGGRHMVAIAADAACLRRNDNGRLIV